MFIPTYFFLFVIFIIGNMRQLNLSREDSLHVVALEGVVIPPLPVPDVTHDGFMDVITTVVVSPSKFWVKIFFTLPVPLCSSSSFFFVFLRLLCLASF